MAEERGSENARRLDLMERDLDLRYSIKLKGKS